MSKFKVNMRVAVIDENEIRKGTIRNIYDAIGVAIVHFDNDAVEKVGFSRLGILEEDEPKEAPVPEEDNSDIDGLGRDLSQTITITRREYIKVLDKVLEAEVYTGVANYMNARSIACVLGSLEYELFDNDESEK